MTGLSAFAGGRAQQANIGGDNYAPITFAGNPAPAPSLHQLPPAIQDFSGRAGDIAEIQRLAGSSHSGPCIINIFGSPGIGKSALTVHVAHRLAEHLDQVQLYAELGEIGGQAPTSTQILQQFVAALEPSTTAIPVSARELPARYRSLLNGRRCLVVLDNAQSAEQIADLVPGATPSVVLITSRASLTAVPAVLPYRLGLMSAAESLELLSNASRRTWPSGQPPSASQMLINQCGRLPLALRILGAILKKKPHWTLEKLAADLAEEQTRLAKLTEGPLDVRSCFEVSYRQLSDNEAEAFRLLSLLPLALFKLRHAASFLQRPEKDAEEAVETLVDAQLLETDDGRDFRFHDLILLYARDLSRAAGDDPEGARAGLFLDELAGEFAAAYVRCLTENSWTGPRPGGSGWSPVRDPGERFQVAADALYIPARLVPAGQPERPESWRDVLARRQRVLVLGAGGTGKTILADRICYEIATAQGDDMLPQGVGFAVPLRLRGEHGQPLATLIADAIRTRYRLDLAAETLTRLLSGPEAVVIFDGLDELRLPSRDRAIQDIDDFGCAYPSAKIIVTSRPGPATAAFAAMDFVPCEIAPFTEADNAAYIERWSQVTHAAPGAYASLLMDIRQDWLATPLLMTQLIVGYDRTGFVPRQEIDLYDMTYSVLFERRDVIRGIQRTAFPPHMTGWLVAYLTYELKARGGALGIPDSEFRHLLSTFEPFYSVGEIDVSRLAEDLADLDLPLRRIPGETADGDARWSVTRDSFSEYLAARWIIGSATAEEVASRLMTVIAADDFIAGSLFVAQLAARQGPDRDQLIAGYLRDVLNNRSGQLPEHTSVAITQILASLT